MTRPLLLSIVGAALLAALLPAQSSDADRAAWKPHRATRVLYAGWPGGSREKAFESFLREWFDKVGVIGLKDLSMSSASGYDVVIADWCSQYGNDGYAKRENALFSAPCKLGPEFTKPVVAMTYVGTQIRGP